MLKQGDLFNRRLYDSYKQELLKGVEGKVVEIGPGTDINFPYLPKGVEWIGIEPNEAFHKGLIETAARHGVHATLLKGSATHILLPDASADAVLCTLVLCSVDDPAKAVAEIKRVLKPGGKFYFVEHVAATAHSRLRSVQNFSNAFNKLMADGCNCNRETWTVIEQAGFSKVNLNHTRVKAALKLHSPHIIGYAVR